MSLPYLNFNWSYSPETAELGFVLSDLDLWPLALTFCMLSKTIQLINTLRPRQNGRHFADDTFKRIFLNENSRISIKISLKLVPKGPIYNSPSLVQIMSWRRSGDWPLSETMLVSLLTHICVTRPQWVKLTDQIIIAFNAAPRGLSYE